MNYEKAYKEALERAKESLKDGTISSNTISYIEEIFPELKESEDEKIRKLLSAYFAKFKPDDMWDADFSCGDIVAWLEKQGDANKEYWRGYREGMEEILDKYAELEKQGEQKPTDKVEPKFHEDDWVFIEEVKGYKNGPFQIKTVDSFGYSFDEYYTIPFMYEDLLSKWSIQDAKDGDVLVFNNNISGIIICKSPTNYDTRSYCRLVSDSFVGKEEGGWDSTLLYPATKEQRDTLFKAMADAGYTFDFEKKELENIEQKSVWSEEDEERIKNIISVLDVQVCWDGATGKKGNPYQREIDWLKSLKPQNRWKPNIEQLEALWCATEKYIESDNEQVRKLRGEVLESLYNDLKKLTE